MFSKQKPNSCALKEKLEILKRLDNDKNITQLSIEFGVGKANISDWKKKQAKTEQFCSATSDKTLQKRQTTTLYEKLDNALVCGLHKKGRKRSLSPVH